MTVASTNKLASDIAFATTYSGLVVVRALYNRESSKVETISMTGLTIAQLALFYFSKQNDPRAGEDASSTQLCERFTYITNGMNVIHFFYSVVSSFINLEKIAYLVLILFPVIRNTVTKMQVEDENHNQRRLLEVTRVLTEPAGIHPEYAELLETERAALRGNPRSSVSVLLQRTVLGAIIPPLIRAWDAEYTRIRAEAWAMIESPEQLRIQQITTELREAEEGGLPVNAEQLREERAELARTLPEGSGPAIFRALAEGSGPAIFRALAVRGATTSQIKATFRAQTIDSKDPIIKVASRIALLFFAILIIRTSFFAVRDIAKTWKFFCNKCSP